MQRRLCIAIAVLGDPPVVVLDEPTTGVDPHHRSIIWGVILALKKKSTVLLTTHDMKECEVLSDRVAIMAGGKLVCEGTAVALKQAYGAGYYVRVLLDRSRFELSQSSSSWVQSWFNALTEQLSGVQLKRVVADHAILHVSKASKGQVPTLLRRLQMEHATLKVKAWDVALTSLEEVLLTVSKDSSVWGENTMLYCLIFWNIVFNSALVFCFRPNFVAKSVVHSL